MLQMLAADDSAFCLDYPEIQSSSLDELGGIVGHAITVLTTFAAGSWKATDKSEAKALYDSWVEEWVPYQNIPGSYMTAKIVPPQIQERFCGLIVRTMALAERTYMSDPTRALAVNYGDLIRALVNLRNRVYPDKKQSAGGGGLVMFVGALLVAGAVGVGVAQYRKHVR